MRGSSSSTARVVREQKFSIIFATNDGEPYFYVVAISRKCLEVSQPTNADGTQIDQINCARNPQQYWRLRTFDDGTYNLVSRFGGCMART